MIVDATRAMTGVAALMLKRQKTEAWHDTKGSRDCYHKRDKILDQIIQIFLG
jgi:hypothetical protein